MTIKVTSEYVLNTSTKEFTDLKNPDDRYEIQWEGLHLLDKGVSYRKVMMKGLITRK
jgi:hypothetical protein